jgi:peptide/nickel transport system ATP-binding protein/oligopeptide transport system ATP-binding protein
MALLDVQHLTKSFRTAPGLFGRTMPPRVVVDDVSFSIERGEVFGLVGESGSGKTTTARCILRLVEPTSGKVVYDGIDVLSLSSGEMRRMRRQMQIVFQDPYSSLNPRMRVGDIVEEPLIVHGINTREDRRARVRELFEMVGLEADHLSRRPEAFSGGQRQRIGLARALALDPSFIVADEPVSALDVSIQGQIIDLLMDLRQRLGLTLLFIAHDLRLVQRICARVAVMYGGRIVEMGNTAAIFSWPRHPYTKSLLSAIPVADPDARRQRIMLDVTSFDRTAPLREVEPGHYAAL